MREPTELKNFVAGEHSAARDGATSPVIDPCTGDIIATAPLTTEADLGHLNPLPAHAQVVTGGSQVSGPGYLFEPTVVTGVLQDDDIVQQETRHELHRHMAMQPATAAEVMPS